MNSAVNINVIFDIQTRAGDSSPFFSPHYKDSLKALKRSKQIIYNKQKTYLSPNKSLNFCSTFFLFPFFLSVFLGGGGGVGWGGGGGGGDAWQQAKEGRDVGRVKS